MFTSMPFLGIQLEHPRATRTRENAVLFTSRSRPGTRAGGRIFNSLISKKPIGGKKGKLSRRLDKFADNFKCYHFVVFDFLVSKLTGLARVYFITASSYSLTKWQNKTQFY